MKINKLITNTTIATYFLAVLISCKKEWLDAKPQKSLVVPTSIADFQAMLDNASSTTDGMNSNQAALDEMSAADFYMTDNNWSARSAKERNTYSWDLENLYDGEFIGDWNYTYQRILVTNTVLEGINKITANTNNEQMAKNNVKGAALFFRAYNHYSISQIFCAPYDPNTAAKELGIPLRLSSDFNEKTVRSNVLTTYTRILSDIKESAELLPISRPDTELYKVRPNKAAAYALAARVYLSMSQYDSALKYADQSLQLYNTLMDYNKISTLTSTAPFVRLNPEVLFHMTLINYAAFATSRLIVDSVLFNSYNSNDLRKIGFFRLNAGVNTFKGKYNTTSNFFSGLATDEVYLVRAECNARKGNLEAALTDINTLLEKRWSSSVPFEPITASTPNEALKKIINERRKELCFRGLRWTDLRRLNKEPELAVSLVRKINGRTYTLLPTDNKKYVLPIPPEVILLSGIEQNQR